MQVRARVWPVLLGVNAQEFDERAYKIWQDQPHRDSNVVNCDVERSLWSYTEGVLFPTPTVPNQNALPSTYSVRRLPQSPLNVEAALNIRPN